MCGPTRMVTAGPKGGSAGYSFFVNIRYVGDESALANTVNSLKSKYFPDL